jgi:hypothetical protein
MYSALGSYVAHATRIKERLIAGGVGVAIGMAAAAVLFLLGAAGCTEIDEHTPPPADWPALTIDERHVAHSAMRDACAPFAPAGMSPEACAVVDFVARRCTIWLSADFPPAREVVDHEWLHCRGHDHVGENTLARAWEAHKAAAAIGAAITRGNR